MIRRKEDECVAIDALRAAARIEDVLGGLDGPRAVDPGVRIFRAKDDQPGLHLVAHLGRTIRHDVHAGEVAARPVLAQPLDELRIHVVRIVLGRPIVGDPRHARLGREPVSAAVLVEIGRAIGEPPQRVAEGRRRLARHGATEPDAGR